MKTFTPWQPKVKKVVQTVQSNHFIGQHPVFHQLYPIRQTLYGDVISGLSERTCCAGGFIHAMIMLEILRALIVLLITA